jgi:hypothetical protein
MGQKMVTRVNPSTTKARTEVLALNWVQGLDLNQRPSGYEREAFSGILRGKNEKKRQKIALCWWLCWFLVAKAAHAVAHCFKPSQSGGSTSAMRGCANAEWKPTCALSRRVASPKAKLPKLRIENWGKEIVLTS